MINEIKTKKEYAKIYETRMNELVNKWKNIEGYDGTQATEEFEENPTIDEIVGYYIVCEEDRAFKQWRENICGIDLSQKDKEIDKILSQLYS